LADAPFIPVHRTGFSGAVSITKFQQDDENFVNFLIEKKVWEKL
jgi:hypothetical protein